MRSWKILDYRLNTTEQQLKTSVLSTFFARWTQNIALYQLLGRQLTLSQLKQDSIHPLFYTIDVMLSSHTFSYILINHHHLSSPLRHMNNDIYIYTHTQRYYSFSSWVMFIKHLSSSISFRLRAPSVIPVCLGRRNGAKSSQSVEQNWASVQCDEQMTSDAAGGWCAPLDCCMLESVLVPSLLCFAQFYHSSFLLDPSDSYCSTMDIAYNNYNNDNIQ